MTDVGEIPLTVRQRGDEVDEVGRNFFPSPILQPEEEGVILPDRAPDAVTKVMFLVARLWRTGKVKIVVRIERFVAGELPHGTVKKVSA